MRTLYYIPITDISEEDIISAKEFFKRYKARFGKNTPFQIYQQEWLQIIKKIKGEIKFIYQGSRFDKDEIFGKFIRKFIEKGASLIPIENKKLFNKQKEVYLDTEILNFAFEEIQKKFESFQDEEDLIFQNEMAKRLKANQKRLSNKWHALERERDKYIAKRINQTLTQEGLGVLFVNESRKVAHELKKFPDIRIIFREE